MPTVVVLHPIERFAALTDCPPGSGEAAEIALGTFQEGRLVQDETAERESQDEEAEGNPVVLSASR